MAEKLIWNRLKSMKCPKCNSALRSIPTDYIACSRKGCVFSMNTVKFNEVVKNLYSKGMQVNENKDNLAELNNL